ncbi:hypothetical protein SAMN05216559_0143 [Halomicrobium zhouii]|uniref:Transposase zinc-ribbon domain-containing protein n=1 Tax=Halomicrobium zhouii TaxID=767519 RepID=A0A1I6K3V8_9EURY|nr:hypothetical protein SAMN05216559_0143 [Halomicrobium zhouii]
MGHQCETCGSFVKFVGMVRGYLTWRCNKCDRNLEFAEVDFDD